MAEEPELYGTLIDLTMTGALCQIRRKADHSPPQIDIADTVMLRCLLPGIKEEQVINGIVRNLTVDNSETRIGVEFADLPSHLANTIGKYLYAVDGLTE
jgi:hypothetical protein